MIYLASASPRRRELLAQIGIEFELLIVDVDESVFDGETPDHYVQRVARLKAQTASLVATKPWPVLAADTIVIGNSQILGKPKDEDDAVKTLTLLSGKTHQVKTAVAIVCAEQSVVKVVTTDVTFRELLAQEILEYWATGEPADKAGSYGIQGIAGKFVKAINGSYSSVVGLPLMETEQLLGQFGGKQ
jgi:septum formation protein